MTDTHEMQNAVDVGDNKKTRKSIDNNHGLSMLLVDVLMIGSYTEYVERMFSFIKQQDVRALRMAMLDVIIKYADDAGIMYRLLHVVSLPWAKIHGKRLCLLYMKDGIHENAPFLLRHLVFPELYMHKLMHKQITFAPVLLVKTIQDCEWNIMFGSTLCGLDKISLIQQRRNEVVARLGVGKLVEHLIYAMNGKISQIEYNIKTGNSSYYDMEILEMIFHILSDFSFYSMPEELAGLMLSRISWLERELKTVNLPKQVAYMLPKPLSEKMLSYILDNLDGRVKWFFGAYYPEWDSANIAQLKQAGEKAESIFKGMKRNDFIRNNHEKRLPESVQENQGNKVESDVNKNTSSKEKMTPATNISLKVVKGFKLDGDEPRLKVYAEMSDKYIPLVITPDPEKIFAHLNAIFPWAERANDVVCRQIGMSRMGRGYVYLNPLLLIGRPGVGKTRYCQVLAKALGIPMIYYGAAGSTDSMLLKGSARGWTSARPSLALESIRQHHIANPMMLIDEIDKAGSGTHNGRVEDYLHSVLEPSSARAVLDECLMVPVNLSAITWMFTANQKDTLSGSLLSRLTTVEIPAPGKQYHEIVVRGVISSVLEEHAIHQNQLPDISDAMWSTFMKSAGNPRMLRKMVEAWVGEVGRRMTMQ